MTLPGRAQELSETQRAFLHNLATALTATRWEDDPLQSKIFEVARHTPIDQAQAFQAIYRVLLDRESGPKAGNLLAFLDPGFVVPRFRELPLDKLGFWRESATGEAELRAWLDQNREKISNISWSSAVEGSVASFELLIQMKDGKTQLKRLLLEGQLIDQAVTGLLARMQSQFPGAVA